MPKHKFAQITKKFCKKCNQITEQYFYKRTDKPKCNSFTCKNCLKIYSEKNRNKLLKRYREYHKQHKEHLRLNKHLYYKKYRHEMLTYQRQKRREMRRKVINHYTNGKMMCAGYSAFDNKCPIEQFLLSLPVETRLDFLQIDHINNNGLAEKRKIGHTFSFYRHLINRKFPKGYQILCVVCNWAKRREIGLVKGL